MFTIEELKLKSDRTVEISQEIERLNEEILSIWNGQKEAIDSDAVSISIPGGRPPLNSPPPPSPSPPNIDVTATMATIDAELSRVAGPALDGQAMAEGLGIPFQESDQIRRK